MKKLYLLDPHYQEYTIYTGHIILDGTWAVEENEIVELTPSDIGLVLDALYEQAMQQGKTAYAKDCKKLAKKIERILR